MRPVRLSDLGQGSVAIALQPPRPTASRMTSAIAFGYLVRQEEHVAGDGHELHVRARLERAALVVGQPAVTLFGVDDPRRDAGPAQPLGGTFVPMQPSHVFAQPVPHVLRIRSCGSPRATRSGVRPTPGRA